MKHGEKITFATLGEARIIQVSSVLTSSFGLNPSPVELTSSQSLLICFEDFYVVLEVAPREKRSLLFPIDQSRIILNKPESKGRSLELRGSDLTEIGKIALSGIHKEPWVGICLRAQSKVNILCSFTSVSSMLEESMLEQSIINVVDLGLLIYEQSLLRDSNAIQKTGLALSVESHKY